MKKILWVVTLSAMFLSFESQAQLGSLKNAKEKLSNNSGKNKSESKNSSASTISKSDNTATTSVNEVKSTKNVAPSDLESGKGYFYTSFKPDGFKTEVNIGNELYVRMQLGKTMIEIAQAKGLQVTSWAYGYITVFIDGNKSFVFGPISFDSRVTKKWLYMDIPLNVKPDFIQKISSDQSMLATDQDIWVFQQLFQENSIMKNYTTTAMKQMTTGNHVVKVELGLSSSDSKKEPEILIASGEVKVVADAAGNKELAMNGPKYLRPLEDNEKGKFAYSSNSFIPGLSELTCKLELPNPPKYYNVKWCKANTCDYENGNLNFYASIDNEPLAYWSSNFDGADYSTNKTFDFVIFPKTDKELGNFEASFNTTKLFKIGTNNNKLVYPLYDKVYNGGLKNGKHTLKIKTYSQECVPYDATYEFQDNFFNQWPSIAETTIEINITDEGKNALIASSSAKKLSHATGEWVAVDKALLASNGSTTNLQVLDIATQTTWKIFKNSLGAILYRTCKADIIYNSKNGCRIEKNKLVREDYSGGGTYGSPYLVSGINYLVGQTELDYMHYPVPISKVK